MLKAVANEAYALLKTLESGGHWGEMFHKATPHNISDEGERGIRRSLTIGGNRGRRTLERLHFRSKSQQTSCDLFFYGF
jgi:hypothetical protein